MATTYGRREQQQVTHIGYLTDNEQRSHYVVKHYKYILYIISEYRQISGMAKVIFECIYKNLRNLNLVPNKFVHSLC